MLVTCHLIVLNSDFKQFMDGIDLNLACSWTSHCVKDGWEAHLGNEKPVIKSLARCSRKNITGIPTYLLTKLTVL